MEAPKPSKPPALVFVWLGLAVLVCVIAALVKLAPALVDGVRGSLRSVATWALLLGPILLVLGVGIADSLGDKRDNDRAKARETPDDQLTPEQRELRRIGRQIEFDMALRQAREARWRDPPNA
jgi:hypothetical protein